VKKSMINFLLYFAFFVLLLFAQLGTMTQMSAALDEADVERFSIWTSIASVIAGLPIFLW
jgi:SNF family Na+-dependent transporter